MLTKDRLLDIRRIYLEPAVRTLAGGQQFGARTPDIEQVEVASHSRQRVVVG